MFLVCWAERWRAAGRSVMDGRAGRGLRERCWDGLVWQIGGLEEIMDLYELFIHDAEVLELIK